MGRAFHLAFPVISIDQTHDFYHRVLGCPVGRRATAWIDFDFYGNQVSAHLKPEACQAGRTNPVDGDDVPVRHFGAILEWAEWEALAARLKEEGVEFIIGPKIRFKGKPGEQGTFFIRDPSGNALEFKTFKVKDMVFATGKEQ